MFFSLLLLAGCSAHKIDIQQGNVVNETLRDQLKIGMTRAQVQQLLGTPLLIDPFRNDRWDYLYYFKPGEGEAQRRHISLFFKEDRLARIVSEFGPRSPQKTPAEPTEAHP